MRALAVLQHGLLGMLDAHAVQADLVRVLGGDLVLAAGAPGELWRGAGHGAVEGHAASCCSCSPCSPPAQLHSHSAVHQPSCAVTLQSTSPAAQSLCSPPAQLQSLCSPPFAVHQHQDSIPAYEPYHCTKDWCTLKVLLRLLAMRQ
ncbi:hypothetical protein AAFF_G00064860 [Aldrovandia affinis]|uniref:Secreted protein n=1 Tax=Aldrovandia affinis TaxID=143900 RepID=A0AAD7T3Y7_9TELE|nr:hypothetical protein AAFF_G00064860 [Aldrovandia affinis]